MTEQRMIPRDETTDGLDPLRLRLNASRTYAKGRVRTEQELMDDEHALELHALGVARGFELLMTDPTLTKKFWERGYDVMSSHWEHNTNQWIGKRLWTGALLFIAGITLVLLLRSGGAMK